MRKDFIPWTEQLPPSNVPLQIYCEVKNFIYPQAYTRQEIEAWSKVAEEIDAVNWSCVGWRLTGVPKKYFLLDRRRKCLPTTLIFIRLRDL